MELDISNRHSGIIEVNPRPGDFLAGGETAIIETAINTMCDWRGSMPSGEWQKLMGVSVNGGSGFETDACVSFSADDALETYGTYCITTEQWKGFEENIQWLRDNGYFGADGRLNFSDRFTAKMSGTTTAGNSLPNVADSIRTNGLVPESAWPFPVDEIKANPANAWAIYYAEIPQSVKDIGLEFKKRFGVMYEWIAWAGNEKTPEQLRAYLAVAPLQIATLPCAPWNTSEIIKACGPGCGHGTMLGNVQLATCFDILDHYVPFQKRLAIDYSITYAMRFVMFPIAAAPTVVPAFQYTFTKQLTYNKASNDANEVKALQTALQTVTDANGKPYMKVGVFGPFGPQTRDALDRFQRANKIVDVDPGCDFGPQTRSAMNAALLKLKN